MILDKNPPQPAIYDRVWGQSVCIAVFERVVEEPGDIVLRFHFVGTAGNYWLKV